jgi:uncharacterized protein (TIGR02466 family)
MNDTSNDAQVFTYFPTFVYSVKKPELLQTVKTVCDEYVQKQKSKQLDEIYPLYMTDNLFNDERMVEFSQAVGQMAWDILREQGYNMDGLNTYFSEMWCQEHYKHSAMEQHVHGLGSQIVGFYFTKTPENCSRVIFHDPRPGKVMINLPETSVNMATPASNMINFVPEEGMLMFTNAWLPHSFTRHAAEDPIQFIHFNLGVGQAANPAPAAEIV